MSAFTHNHLFHCHDKISQDNLTVWVIPMFNLFNECIFYGKLTKYMTCVKWQKKMTRTAGQCRIKTVKGISDAEIILSPSLVNSTARLAEVLLHEMCHLAVVVIDKTHNHHHGPKFYAWGERATSVFPSLKVSRCHRYAVEKNFIYKCKKCDKVLKKTTRKSPKALQKICKKCGCSTYLSYNVE